MPIREYRCPNCGAEIEIFTGGAVNWVKCDCDATMEELVSAPAPVRVGKYGKAGGLCPSSSEQN